jgi:hypothetical protein
MVLGDRRSSDICYVAENLTTNGCGLANNQPPGISSGRHEALGRTLFECASVWVRCCHSPLLLSSPWVPAEAHSSCCCLFCLHARGRAGGWARLVTPTGVLQQPGYCHQCVLVIPKEMLQAGCCKGTCGGHQGVSCGLCTGKGVC